MNMAVNATTTTLIVNVTMSSMSVNPPYRLRGDAHRVVLQEYLLLAATDQSLVR